MAEHSAGRRGTGWDVVHAAAAAGSARFGSRLVAVYALGSLAHGGFSPLVSDVDVGFVLADLREPDETALADLAAEMRESGVMLAERLSVFWGTVDSLSGRTSGGRFPPLDRLDLIRHGVLVRGSDARAGLPEPSYEDLVRGGAAFAVEVLGRPQRRQEIVDASSTADGGPRKASKVALFPVRFLYTSRTGRIGENIAAINHYLESSPHGPTRALVVAAQRWRTHWEADDAKRAVPLLANGAIPLYKQFAEDYQQRLGDDELGDRLLSWAASLVTEGPSSGRGGA